MTLGQYTVVWSVCWSRVFARRSNWCNPIVGARLETGRQAGIRVDYASKRMAISEATGRLMKAAMIPED